jgi:hypothetical protein
MPRGFGDSDGYLQISIMFSKCVDVLDPVFNLMGCLSVMLMTMMMTMLCYCCCCCCCCCCCYCYCCCCFSSYRADAGSSSSALATFSLNSGRLSSPLLRPMTVSSRGGDVGGGGALPPSSLGRSFTAFSSPVPKPCTTFVVRPAAAIAAVPPPPAFTSVGATMTRVRAGPSLGRNFVGPDSGGDGGIGSRLGPTAWGTGRNFVGSDSGNDRGSGGWSGPGRPSVIGGRNFMGVDDVRLPAAMSLAPPTVVVGSSGDGVFFRPAAQVQ